MIRHPDRYDVIVIGGGHAGTEAALAAARAGASTLLLTQSIETIGQMSCNPAIGGIGKSHLVREIDALGGAMARAADLAGIHFRTLNSRKGPAVRATRAQADRTLYRAAIRQIVENQPHLNVFQQSVVDLVVEHGDGSEVVCGVDTQMGLRFEASTVVLTTGTFLGGRIHIGLENAPGGRAGDAPSNALADRLRALPFRVDRLKTGTPPRIDGRTVDFSVLERQPGDVPRPVMSFHADTSVHPRQVDCHITRTNDDTHALIKKGLDRSPMVTGVIEGIGPRYCPSIEDKVIRFADRDSHQIFVEPEGLDTHELYPNGISTSLPFDVQQQLVHSIEGFEKAHITRPGYAIEYDFFDPRDLKPSLETRAVRGLFFAGQINGTTGYEEAGAQGLVAGLNAARATRDEAPWIPARYEAYIGVLIDDLVTLGTNEPYRMFTSRAEYRLRLRQDNADTRLTPIGRELGLIEDDAWNAFGAKIDGRERAKKALAGERVRPGSVLAQAIEQVSGETIANEATLLELLRRPQITAATLTTIGFERFAEALDDVEIEAKYAGYIARQDAEIDRVKAHERVVLGADFDFAIEGLSNELREKLNALRPATLAHAARVPGVTPAALSLLLVHAKRHAAAAGPARQVG